jgi:imidazolonepropionase-like amidohydrolase
MRLALLALLLAQDPAKPAEKKPEPKKTSWVALVGGDVDTVTKGLLKGATLLLKDGKIHRIGTEVEIPEGAERHDVKGKRVMPGFIACNARGLGVSGFASSAKIADAVDPYQEQIKLALASGITAAYVEFGSAGGFFGGRTQGTSATSAVLKMAYGDLDGMVVAEPASASLSTWLTGSASQRYDIREGFTQARAFLEKLKDYEQRKAAGRLATGENAPNPPPGRDTYVKLLKGEAIARISASSADEIRRALALVNDYKFKCVLVDVVEGWTLADEIGRARCWCIVTPRAKQYASRNVNRPNGSSIEQCAILRKAGVKFGIVPLTPAVSTGGIAGRDLINLNLEAAFAVRGGCDEAAAVESLTITAAEICGVDGRMGSLEEGKDADVIVLDGDPLDYRTFVEMTFVDGKLLYEKDKSPYYSHLKRK